MEEFARDAVLRQSMTRLLHRAAVSKGEITVPAVPAMLDDYVALVQNTFSSVGVDFSAGNSAQLRDILATQLAQAQAASPRSEIVISYEIPVGLTASYHVRAQWNSMEQAYSTRVASREAAAGAHPDARVCALAEGAADPTKFPVLDVGAGTGRNTLALARRGHPVDALETTEAFTAIIGAAARREGLQVRVLNHRSPETVAAIRRDYRLIVLSEVVCDFRTTEELRGMFELAAQRLAPGGHLVFNVFLARGGYQPDAAAMELGRQCATMMFTYPQLATAAAGQPLDLVAADSVYEYEKANLPTGAWPPTSWYADWVSGLDVFDVPRGESPIELRWMVYRKGG